MTVAKQDAPLFRTSPSAIARYFFHDCERFLRYHAASPQRRKQDQIPETAFDHSPLVHAILESGYHWERTVVEQMLGDRVAVAAGRGELHTRRFDWAATIDWLRAAEPGQCIYQPTLRLPRWFYQRYQIDPQLVLISDNHPDLLTVEPDPDGGGRLLRVVDLKRGDSLELTHRVQVLLYALELDAVLQTERIDGLRVDLECGQVWLGSHPAPESFDLTDFRPHLERFLSRDLVRILSQEAKDARWHLYYRCEWCDYFEHCRTQMQAENDLSRLSHLSASGKRYLREEAGVNDVSGLKRFLQHDDADRTLGQCASLAGQGPRLAGQAEALETDQLQTHGAASPSLSKGENIGVFLTLQQEPLGRSVYLAGIHLTVRKDLRDTVFSGDVADRFFEGAKSHPLILLAESPERVDEIRREWVRVLHALITQVDAYNRDRQWREQLSLQAYVLTDQERGLLVEWLLESLQDAERPELAEQAMTVLFHFQAPELMVANQHPDREVPFPVVVLLDALGHVLALPVEVSYTLPESLATIGSRFQLRRNDYFHFPLGHGLRADAIHAAWYRGKTETLPDIAAQAVALLRAARELLQGVRHHAADAIFAWAARFSLPERDEYADPLLSRLAFFARYESLLGCLDLRHLRCEPHAVQMLLGKVLELESLGDGEFSICGPAAMPVEPGGFPEWLLVTRDDAGRRAQLEYRDYACRSQLWKGQPHSNLAVVGVTDMRHDKFGAPSTLSVEYARPFSGGAPAAGQRLLLYPRFTDYTTDGVVRFLRDYDRVVNRQGDGELFLSLLRDPAKASASLSLANDTLSEVESLSRPLSLTPSQVESLQAICQRRVVPVWGPPGTGKTHFLATAILVMAAAHARTGRPFRVLVTAFTHAAIENLLRKIAALQSSVAADATVVIAKAKSWHGNNESPVATVEEKQLARWLKQHDVAIVGATVYTSLKAYEKLPDFDLVVIDEASQVRVPEAAVPIGLASRDGRLVLAGDHLQLPPIVKGVYPAVPVGEPVLHRSIFEAVMGAGSVEQLSQLLRSGNSGGANNWGSCSTILHENFRMNDVLSSFAAGLLYGPDYQPNDSAIAGRRLNLTAENSLDPFVQACLDPDSPLVVVVLDGVRAARENPLEAQLVARLVVGLRHVLRDANDSLYENDADFFSSGVFLVSPHRVQIQLIQRELRRQRTWQQTPFVDTVDKVQGQEADAVIVSYGVSDPEFAAQEAEFIYGLNRLNVAITRARTKCVVFLPRPLLDASPHILGRPEAVRGLAYMRQLVAAIERAGSQQQFDVDEGVQATVLAASRCFVPETEPASDAAIDAAAIPDTDDYVDDSVAEVEKPAKRPRKYTADKEPNMPAAKRPAKKKTAKRAKAGVKSPASQSSTALAALNEPQREAVCHGDDPLLIVAGAGTGKTTTLVHRVAHLISQGAEPNRILLLTFTRRAANEMLQRVAAVVDDLQVSRRVWGGTFHAIGMRLLRSYSAAVGLSPRFTIHDRSDSESLMNVVCQDLELGKGDKKFPKKGTCMAIHSYSVNSQQPLEATLKQQFDGFTQYEKQLGKLFDEYTRRKAELNVLDYDDLLSRWCDLLEHDEVGDLIRRRFDYVLVDEYQDTNRLQSRLLDRLCPDGRGLTVVGDDAQSIYSFRAATVRNILDFPQQFPGARVIKLEENYRSTSPILQASNQVIAQARERFTKDLWTSRDDGVRPQVISCDDDAQQVDFVVGRILQHKKEGVPLAEQAVLIRAGHHSIKLEAELKRRRLEYVKFGGMKFTDTAHVKDLAAILRLVENPADRVAGERALCLLPGVGPKKAAQLQFALCEAQGDFSVWRDIKVPAKATGIWPGFHELMVRLAGKTSGDLDEQVKRSIKFYTPLLEHHYDNHAQRMADLEQVQQLAGQYETRTELLGSLAIDPPDGEDLAGERDGDRLVISTLHSAKGLEWKAVYVIHAVDGKIPLERASFDPDQLEEERRMFYVALTRAADWLYVCHPEREPVDFRNNWYASMNAGESLELTRFITSKVMQEMDRQYAASYTPPSAAARKPTKKTRRKASQTQ